MYRGIKTFDDWRFKQYAVVYGTSAFDAPAYEAALPRAFSGLPSPAATATRPGVGFLIMHQGRGFHYLVLCWWDNENELPIKVFVRPFDSSEWRPAAEHESVCVWDLEIIAFERDAYVKHVLAPVAKVEAYVCARFVREVDENRTFLRNTDREGV
jgi:hypothetical protein